MDRSSIPFSKGVEPSEAEQQQVKAMVRMFGESRSADRLGIDRMTLSRIAAGFPVQRSTLAAVQARLSGGPVVDERQMELPIERAA